MEAYVKTDKPGLHLKNLRTRNLVGIRAFVLLTCMAHNLMVHALRSMKRLIKNGSMGVKAFVEKLACARGWFVRKGEVLVLLFTEENPVIKQYIRYARGPSLLDYMTWAHLHKTKVARIKITVDAYKHECCGHKWSSRKDEMPLVCPVSLFSLGKTEKFEEKIGMQE